MFYSLRLATKNDRQKIKSFVGQAGLSTEGIETTIQHFMILEHENTIVGCIGIEIIEQDALLRAFVASKEVQQAHLITLLESIDILAERENIRNVYLVTSDGASLEFLELVGFHAIDVDRVPLHIGTNPHVKKAINNDSTRVMVK